MARIRTIKPEFWTDGKVVQLPFHVRLIFIGLWNFCDDEGYLHEEHDRIKMQVMPGDDVDVEAAIDLLVACELLSRLQTASGGTALLINHFCEHQKISHSTPSRIAPEVSGKLQIKAEDRRAVAIKYGCKPGGSIDVACYSCGMEGSIWWPTTQKGKPSYWVSFSGMELAHFEAEANGGETKAENLVLCCRRCNRSMGTTTPVEHVLRKIPENSGGFPLERKGKEGKGKEQGKEGEGEGEKTAADAGPSLFQEVIDYWNEKRSQNCRMTDGRRKALATRWKDRWWRSNWRMAIDRCCETEFCNGRNDRGWVADLDWFLKPESATRLIEGKYANGKPITEEIPF